MRRRRQIVTHVEDAHWQHFLGGRRLIRIDYEAPRCHEAAAWIFIPPGGIKPNVVESKSRKISFIP